MWLTSVASCCEILHTVWLSSFRGWVICGEEGIGLATNVALPMFLGVWVVWVGGLGVGGLTCPQKL